MLIADSVDLTDTMAKLAKRRPVFHSEADFQFAFAWEVQSADQLMRVYLETRPYESVHLDLAFERPDLEAYTAVEVKYLTRRLDGDDEAQVYALKNHSAHDHRRYDVVRDIERVEKFTELRPGANGAVILLANDPAYWRESAGSTASDAAFRVGEGAILEGERAWGKGPADVKRQLPLNLSGTYEMRWSDYSQPNGHLFRQLVIGIPARLTRRIEPSN